MARCSTLNDTSTRLCQVVCCRPWLRSLTPCRACLADAPTFEQPEKSNCLALLALVSLLWCTEALPLFVTSMLVPLLAVVLRVLVDSSQQPPQRLTPQQAAPRIFHAMCSQVLLGLWLASVGHARCRAVFSAAAVVRHASGGTAQNRKLSEGLCYGRDHPHASWSSLRMQIAHRWLPGHQQAV